MKSNRRHRLRTRPVKVWYLNPKGQIAGNLITNAHVLSTYVGLVGIWSAYNKNALVYLESAGLRDLENPSHPIHAWIKQSKGCAHWFSNYFYTVHRRYMKLRPHCNLSKIVNMTVYYAFSAGTAHPAYETIKVNDYFDKYLPLCVFNENNTGKTYPLTFENYLTEKGIPRTQLENAEERPDALIRW
jgi:hypothetical protein